MTLTELFAKYPTDKLSAHSYAPLYEEVLAPYRESATAILEIGIEHGQSLRAWREYFPRANVYGIDNAKSKMFDEDRIATFHADTTDRDGFLGVIYRLPQLDIVFDDGGHVISCQLFTVAALWSKLKPGGLFIVEDIAKPEYLALFSAFQGATLHDRRKIRGQHDDMLAVMRKP